MAYDRKYGIINAQYGDEAHHRGAGIALNESTELVFVIRAQDVCAVSAVEAYAVIAEKLGASTETVEAVREVAAEMLQWQSENQELVKKDG